MRRKNAILAASLTVLLVIFCLPSCGGSGNNSKDGKYEVAMITDGESIEDGSFNQTAWESIEKFAGENDLTCKYYVPKSTAEPTTEAATEAGTTADANKNSKKEKTKEKKKAADVPLTKADYLAAVQKAADKGAKIIIMAGSVFETTVYDAQAAYPKIDFLLIDGVPHDDKNNYVTANNTLSIIFAEEEAGYLAGYAAVKDGYKKIGFMGGVEQLDVKRYGYGYVQGAAAAAEETKTKIEINYVYTGTFDKSDEVKKQAETWYKDGTKVIFACRGEMVESVIAAAEKKKGKVIGVDVDQSYLSDSVITSTKKGLAVAIEKVLNDYSNGSFVGGHAFNYAAKNDGVMLEMENAQFSKFTEDDYKKVFRNLKNGKIVLKKDTEVKAVQELANEWVTIK